MTAKPPDATTVRFGLFEVDLRSGELWRSGVKIRLQEQPLQVLVALLERPGQLVTREELRARLWPADTFVDFDHSLNTAVKRLREALGLYRPPYGHGAFRRPAQPFVSRLRPSASRWPPASSAP